MTAVGALLAAPTLALAHSATQRGAPAPNDPLRAVIFAGQDAVIDLGPIVPTPGAATPALEPAAPPTAATSEPPRFTVTRVGSNGARETRAIDAAELQTLGHPAPPPIAHVETPAKRATTASRSQIAVAASPSEVDSGGDLTSTAADAVSPVLVRSAARPKTKSVALVRDGRSYGQKGRFYVFAAGKGGGVGLNVIDQGEHWGGDGLSWDRTGFVGQRSAGVGWRKGDVSTSLGWAHAKSVMRGFYGFPSEKDERVALNLTWRPSPR